MTINLKIEVLKIFCLEFGFSSEKKEEEKEDVQESIDLLDILQQPSNGK